MNPALLSAALAYVYAHRAAFLMFGLTLAFQIATQNYAAIPAAVLTLLVALGLVASPPAAKMLLRR